MRTYDIAVVGATGNVGRQMLTLLEERKFPIRSIVALASARSVGKEISFGEEKILKVQDVQHFDFSSCQLALFSPGSQASSIYAPKAVAQGCWVIDNSSYFRMHTDVPLVVPEINADVLLDKMGPSIIANPNCSTIQLVMALKPLHACVPIKKVVVSTYQSVSGAGKAAMDELFDHTRQMYMNQKKDPEQFTRPIVFNCIPQIDHFMEDGFTKEEWKMRVETQKILDPNIEVVAQCVRVPVFIGHCESVWVEFEGPIEVEEAANALANEAGVVFMEKPEDFVTSIECVGEEGVYVSRLRQDPFSKNCLIFWCSSDNLMKGAALNAIQIAEYLAQEGKL
jgi:aspartate-semialdehyde dehydrogenase